MVEQGSEEVEARVDGVGNNPGLEAEAGPGEEDLGSQVFAADGHMPGQLDWGSPCLWGKEKERRKERRKERKGREKDDEKTKGKIGKVRKKGSWHWRNSEETSVLTKQ